MKNEKKFLPREQQHVSQTHLQSQQTVHEFAMPEDALRFDAEHTAVPDRVGQRLSHSLKNAPNLSRPWWKRLFS
jgi:hypothetical protein